MLRSPPHATLGEFIAECSEIETNLRDELQELAGTDRSVFSAIVGKPRISDLLSMLSAVAKVKLAGDDRRQLEALLGHINYIFDVRAVLAHEAVRMFGDKVGFIPTWSGRTGQRAARYECTEAQLKTLVTFTKFMGLWLTFYRQRTPVEDKGVVEVRQKLQQVMRRTHQLPDHPADQRNRSQAKQRKDMGP